MDRQQCVLVLGATGYAGRHIVRQLHDGGYRVRAVVRDKQRALETGAYDAPALHGRVDEWIVSSDGSQLDASIMTEVDHVVSALGVTRQQADPWTVDFLLNLHYLKLAEQQDVKTFMYIGVMNAATGTSTVSRAKHAFMEALGRSSVRAQIVNPSAYFSDLTEVFNVARRGMAFGLGNGSVQLSPIHGADLADFCLAKLSDDAGTWDVGGPEVLTYRQVVQLAFQTLGRKERYLPIPGVVASSAVWLTDRVSPRAASLMRFFLEGIQTDSVGALHGHRTLGEYYASLR
ncbi:MAG: SDR family oxidoreductase [Yaniella sp.]|uniref:SDR family oxidoreductase n=1 Tax=Yaniella sp. TaxID=2773929 RepID=UPI00264808BA|nr:NAD(P)H-binding protein [Yaniella sp.]MDN5732033.1 NAD(P)H-binding protein [Yaniella sp.]MDN6535001.1 NAD(P)H-binding protein [Yaniella sp.]MDN6758381.1 NAD(P)H-binding protein [Yaniella sp.]